MDKNDLNNISEEKNWHFRDNYKRKEGDSKKGLHPCLIVGESHDQNAFVNIGLTKSPKRGHHKNKAIHNPEDWNKTSYLRDDIRIDNKKDLSDVLSNFKLDPDDIDKIWDIINKKRAPTRR